MTTTTRSKGDEALARLRRLRQTKTSDAEPNPRLRLYGTDALLDVFKTPNPSSMAVAKWVTSWRSEPSTPHVLIPLTSKSATVVKKECVDLLDHLGINRLYYDFVYHQSVNEDSQDNQLMLKVAFYHTEDYVMFKMSHT
jgi:hypothetical protein